MKTFQKLGKILVRIMKRRQRLKDIITHLQYKIIQSSLKLKEKRMKILTLI